MASNVSDIERKVILINKREVPHEVCFQLSDAQQDPIKKNRYWFTLPEEWSNRYDKDSIIGIRNAYLTKTNILIRYVMIVYDTHTAGLSLRSGLIVNIAYQVIYFKGLCHDNFTLEINNLFEEILSL